MVLESDLGCVIAKLSRKLVEFNFFMLGFIKRKELFGVTYSTWHHLILKRGGARVRLEELKARFRVRISI